MAFSVYANLELRFTYYERAAFRTGKRPDTRSTFRLCISLLTEPIITLGKHVEIARDRFASNRFAFTGVNSDGKR